MTNIDLIKASFISIQVFDENLNKRSVEINIKMQEIGVEAYYKLIKDKPRFKVRLINAW